MINTPLKLPFPWYKNVLSQNSYKAAYRGESCYRLITPNTRLLPFQIQDAAILKATAVSAWGIYSTDGTLVFNLIGDIALITSHRNAANTVGWMVYNGNIIFSLADMDCGYYYSKITKDGVDFFSEVFYVPHNFSVLNYMRIVAWNTCDAGDILFQTGFKVNLYLEAEIERTAHEIYEEGIEDGYKRFFPQVQVYKQTLRFDEFCPDYLVAALVALQICEFVQVTTKNGLETGNAENIKTNVAWEENAGSALVEVKFQQEENLMKTGCCKNILLE